ncbi:MAG: hypothetical protein AB1742_16095 [bacterium]
MTDFIAVDPGRQKCGLALMERSGAVRERAAVSAENAGDKISEWMERCAGVDTIAIGNGVGHKEIMNALAERFPLVKLEIVDEAGTTLEARRLFLRHNPGKRFWMVFPFSLFAPGTLLDKYAAEAIGLRRLRAKR